MGFFDAIRTLRPLGKNDKKNLDELDGYIDEDDLNSVRKLIKQGRVNVSYESFGVSKKISADIDHPRLNLVRKDDEEMKYVEDLNTQIRNLARRKVFKQFSTNAGERITSLIAPAIVGFDNIKRTVALQMFATDPFHVLLLGDPGTGKTQILSAAAEMMPLSSFGLGSGTSGVGLAATVKGKVITKGLLPMADGGLCAIDELNLMKPSDMAAMYNAMEKGFVTYTKGSNNLRFEAKVRVLATANPKGDRFIGKIVDVLKQQLPFDPALLSRFHIVFLVRRPNASQFKEISRHIVKNSKEVITKADIEFVKEYITFSERIDVNFSKDFEHRVADFAETIKQNEKKYLIEVSPRLIVGLIRLAKASARMHLRKDVSEEDLTFAEDIVKGSLEI